MMYRQPVPVTGVTGAFLHVHRLSLSPKSNSIEPPSNKCPRACTGPPIQDSRPKNICRGQVFFLIAQSSAMRDPTAFTYIYGLCTFTHIFMRSPISFEILSITRIKCFFIIFFFFVSWKFSCYSSLNFKLLSQLFFLTYSSFLKKKESYTCYIYNTNSHFVSSENGETMQERFTSQRILATCFIKFHTIFDSPSSLPSFLPLAFLESRV